MAVKMNKLKYEGKILSNKEQQEYKVEISNITHIFFARTQNKR